MTRHSTQHGSVSVELVLLTPVLVGLFCLIVSFGRLEAARADIEAAARTAARAASIERTAAAADQAGTAAANAELDGSGYRCQTLHIDIDTAQFAAAGTVTAQVACTVALADVTGMGIPRAHTFTARFSEPVDHYRGTR